MNYDNWKLASPDDYGCELLSPCCGSHYTDGFDEDSLEVYICDSCKEQFDEPIEDYEFKSRMRDSYLEDIMDDRRLGL